ncbi:MAG: gfo/Idh/MocA family oxidoreductase, partial [Thermotoga sp.]
RLRKDIAGSGALGDLGSHIIDIARFLVGEIASVMAQTRTFIKERPLPEDPSKKGKVDVDDAFAAVVEFENGAIGTLEASRFCYGRKNYQYWEINGSKGSIRFNLERLNELEVYLAKEGEAKLVGAKDIMVTESYHPYMEHWWPHGHIIGWEHAQVHAIYHLFDCIVNDKNVEPWGASFRDGYRALVVEEAILRSAEIGKRVDITYEI